MELTLLDVAELLKIIPTYEHHAKQESLREQDDQSKLMN
jgi:hypothetical protein